MPHKPLLFGVLATEGLHYADCAEHLLHNGEGGTVIGFCFARPAAQSPPIDLRNHVKDWRNEKRDQCQLPVDARGNVNHSSERQAGLDEWNQVIDGDRLDRCGIRLHAIERIHSALGIVIGQGQALDLTEKLRSELQQEIFAGVGLEHRYSQILQLRENGDDDQQRNGKDQRRRGSDRKSGGPQGTNQPRNGMRTQSAVHGDLEWQGHEQGERTREQTEQEESGNMSPVRTRLLKQAPVKDIVARFSHLASSNPSFFSARQTAALALPTAWKVSPPTANARAPRT